MPKDRPLRSMEEGNGRASRGPLRTNDRHLLTHLADHPRPRPADELRGLAAAVGQVGSSTDPLVGANESVQRKRAGEIEEHRAVELVRSAHCRKHHLNGAAAGGGA